MTRLIAGLSEIADAYDAFLLDQWGVLHNGAIAHDGAVEAVRRLAEAGKKTVILSNSGKRAADSYRRMAELGFPRQDYLDIVTSGETVHRCFMTRPDPFYRALGRRVFVFAWDADRGILEETGLEEVASVHEADFILCAGTDRQDLDAYRPDLRVGIDKGLAMICANPDRVAVQPDGNLRLCPGAIADLYEEMGGTVRWHGKPTAEIYRACEDIAGGWDSALGIGDSMIHDIKGAADFGLDSLFIAGGVHKDELTGPLSPDAVARVGAPYGQTPDFASAAFRW
ncbi:MAG: TIGR01459 family HAD-type hydrolase [Alphaproteobacteria bacterium]|nr:TIGR01459 family HAD-type hydrolase [Alphaproteobacteria bacterium]